MILIYILLIILNIPTELEGPTTLVANDFSLPLITLSNVSIAFLLETYPTTQVLQLALEIQKVVIGMILY